MKDYEDMKATFREVKGWTSDASECANVLVENLVSAYDSTSSLLSKIQDIDEAWEDIEEIQSKIIPCLKTIRGLSQQDLVDGKVIQGGDISDFSSWYFALATMVESLRKSEARCLEIEKTIRSIQDKIFLVVVEILQQDEVREKHLRAKNLRAKFKGNFFKVSRPILKDYLTRISRFLLIDENFLAQAADWENTLATCTDDVDMVDYRIGSLPHVTMEEVRPLVSRYIEFAASKKGN